jgi:enoyl-CoA hydratase/carnithine racemase
MNTPPSPAAPPVLFEERFTDNGMRLGIATLNVPKTLNCLSLEMVDLLQGKLRGWAADPLIAAVILQGAGDRAFCAGGDLHSLYRSMVEHEGQGAWGTPYARDFFEREYRLDYSIHTYPKPLLCWGRGIVMGGGIGLMAGASHRVIATDARVAMPEISIGLFPDVGGSWLLNRVPGRAGLFLALTGAPLNAADAVYAGLAQFRLEPDAWPELLEDLLALPWAGHPGRGGPAARSINDGLLRRAIHAREPSPGDPGPLKQHTFLINTLCTEMNLRVIYQEVAALAFHEDPWLAAAANAMLAGSPGAARLAFDLQRKTRMLPLPDVFRAEYVAALHCAAGGDFREGIRALIIDKDKKPRWHPSTLEAADSAWAQAFFAEPWPEGTGHPLADLDRKQT